MLKRISALIAAVIASAIPLSAGAQNYLEVTTPVLALSNSAQSIKAAPGAVIAISCVNPNATPVYVQFFDSAGVVTVGTTAPTWVEFIPAASASGLLPPATPSKTYFANAGMQIAGTTTASGGSAPSLPISCDVVHR